MAIKLISKNLKNLIEKNKLKTYTTGRKFKYDVKEQNRKDSQLKSLGTSKF